MIPELICMYQKDTCHNILLVTQLTQVGVVPIAQTDNLPAAGRLKHHISTLEVITKDPWVLTTIQGYRVDFLWEPLQSTQPHTVDPSNPDTMGGGTAVRPDYRGVLI